MWKRCLCHEVAAFATLSVRIPGQARDDKILDVVRKGEQLRFSDWADFFLENYSKPPIRAEKTHEANGRAALHLKEAFGQRSVGDISADDIENYLRRRLQARVQVRTAGGVIQRDRLKPATVHQELRVLRRMMNVAVRNKLLPANPCAGVEFPVKVKGLFRPQYMAWSEQQRIEFQAPEYLRNIIRIIIFIVSSLYTRSPDSVTVERQIRCAPTINATGSLPEPLADEWMVPASWTSPAACDIYQAWLQRLRIPQRFPHPDWSIADKWIAKELLRQGTPVAVVAELLRWGSPGFPRRHAAPHDYLRRTLARALGELAGNAFPAPAHGAHCVPEAGFS